MMLLTAVFLGFAVGQSGSQLMRVTPANEFVAGQSTVHALLNHVSSELGSQNEPPQMPGWPVTIDADPYFAPMRGATLADLDKDGKLEVLVPSTAGKLYAWRLDGSLYGNFPVSTIGFPQYAPSVADLDRDGKPEIVQTTRGWTEGGRLYVFDNLGNLVTGWPKSLNNHNVEYAAALADLDNDSHLEIIVGERAYPSGLLHVFEKDGSEWGGNWPVTLDHVPAQSAAVGDVDLDGNKEVFYTSYDSMYLLRNDGTLMPGWPKQIPNAKFSYQCAALADLNGDGTLEIVVGAHSNAPGVYAFHYDGSSVTGWPKRVNTWTYCPPTVADLENNAIADIAAGQAGYVSGSSRCFWVWNSSGQVRSGFPYVSDHGGGSEGPLTVADVDADGLQEIFADHNIMIDNQGYLFGVDAAGQDLPGFPLRTNGFTYMNSATIGDVDCNGTYELAVVAVNGNQITVYLYTLPSNYKRSGLEWPTYHARNSRDGLRSPQLVLPSSVTTVKGTYVSGSVQSLAAADGDAWLQAAQYDPTDPTAFLNSSFYADGYAAASSYDSAEIAALVRSTSVNTTYRIRAMRPDGSWFSAASNVPGSLTYIFIGRDLPKPVSQFINSASGNSLRLEVRNSTPNRAGGFFRHYTDLVQWELTP